MINRYTAVCVQSNRSGVSHRKEIREANLNRALELVDYASVRLGFNDHYAPTKLVLFPEVFMQGWWRDPGAYKTVLEKVAKDIAIRIPGEETDLLAEKARKHKVFIAGTAHEVIPEISAEYPFNCAFVISPEGEVILKYHKYNNYLVRSGRDDASPHDVYDRYLEVMDGKYGRRKGDRLSCLFPVVETEIGKLGYIVCNDGFTFENFRALGIQGCEVMLRSSGMLEPEGSPPQEIWEIGNRAGAFFNLMYVVAAAPGDIVAPGFPSNVFPGHSMVVDFHGAILAHANYQGEAATAAVIDVDMLRSRRMDPKHHWVTQMRMDAYREIYARTGYPKNLFLERGPLDYGERIDEQIAVIKRFVKEGVYIPPRE